ncbi:MAG: peptide-methionine (S)-S-oxide reductase [Nitrospira sp.]|nr:peptide-methionine (S)-S-oxide reductase [Nitrospira sp.]
MPFGDFLLWRNTAPHSRDLVKTLTEEKLYGASIVTQVVPAGQWYEAEPYHQEYFVRNPSKITVSLWWVQKAPSLESSLLIA